MEIEATKEVSHQMKMFCLSNSHVPLSLFDEPMTSTLAQLDKKSPGCWSSIGSLDEWTNTQTGSKMLK